MAANYPLAFSTLGCPDWSFEHAATQAAHNGYEALEVRILDGETIPSSLPRRRIDEIKQVCLRTGVGINALGLSTRHTSPDPDERRRNQEELRSSIELAAQLGAPMVRTFGGDVADGVSLEQAIEWVAEGIAAAVPAAESNEVVILLETHDAFCRGEEVAAALASVDSPWVGAVWDVHHPFRMGESIEDTWRFIGPHVKHVHVKDARLLPSGEWQLVLMGEGEVPCRDILSLLHREGYEGYICAEWEKKWHPEIEEPEIAMPQHAEILNRWMSELEP